MHNVNDMVTDDHLRKQVRRGEGMGGEKGGGGGGGQNTKQSENLQQPSQFSTG